MNELAPVDTYGTLSEPATLTIRRLLPGPIDRVWAYLTESDLRRRWLASGTMELRAGAPCELVWRNDELSEPPARRPAGFAEENRMQSRIVEVEPPHRLTIAWDGSGDVTFELQRQGSPGAFHRHASPLARSRHHAQGGGRLARPSRHAGLLRQRAAAGTLLGPLERPQEGV